MNSKINSIRRITLLVVVIFMLGLLWGNLNMKAYGATDSQFEAQLNEQGFPESYKTELRKLHEQYPNWKFKAKNLGFTFDEALAKQYSNVNANLVAVSFPDSFKAVRSGTYNFNTHTYIAKDGSNWVSASKAAVAFYMDPRNWLSADSIFMFESASYDPAVQTESIVKKILSTTALPGEASAYYMSAAQQNYNGTSYNISPVYLAAKTRIELGSSDFMVNGHAFEYGGKSYQGVYNTYNIGSSDSSDGSAATKGLVYAAGGTDGSGTSWLRPWNTLEQAIKGGAIYIANGYLMNNQGTLYTERFNVANGIENIGTHQYQTSIFAAATQSSITYDNYKSFGVLDESFSFEIPVYSSMPSVASKPSNSGNNNCYLDSFTVSSGSNNYTFTPSFNRFTSTYNLEETLPSSVSKVAITTVKNAEDSIVTISGNTDLSYGQNKITIKCKSSAGAVSKYYYIYVNRDKPKIYIPETPTNLTVTSTGGSNVKLSWSGDKNATGYSVMYKRTNLNRWYTVDVKNVESYEKKMATAGILYDFKVRAFYEEGGERTYSSGYTQVVKGATFGDWDKTLTGSLFGGYMTVKLDWPDVTGADGYTVYYRERNTEEWQTADVLESTYKGKMARAGKGYEFKVVAYKTVDGLKLESGDISSIKTIYTLRKTTLRVEKKSTTSAAVRWTNISGETGYEIYRSNKQSSGFTRVIKASNKYDYWLNKGLTKGKTYYYKIRAYRNTATGVYVYGPYSETIAVKL